MPLALLLNHLWLKASKHQSVDCAKTSTHHRALTRTQIIAVAFQQTLTSAQVVLVSSGWLLGWSRYRKKMGKCFRRASGAKWDEESAGNTGFTWKARFDIKNKQIMKQLIHLKCISNNLICWNTTHDRSGPKSKQYNNKKCSCSFVC